MYLLTYSRTTSQSDLDEGAEEALARGDVELHVDRRVREAHGEVRLQRVRLPDLRWRRGRRGGGGAMRTWRVLFRTRAQRTAPTAPT